MDETKSRSRSRKAAPKPAAPAKGAATKRPRKPATTAAAPAAASRDEMVRTAAYFRAERRGFTSGYEIEDWIAAEAEVSAREQTGTAPKPRKSPARKPRAG